MLDDDGYTGSQFTWCNNQMGEDRIMARLDRCLVNLHCQSLQVKVTNLPRSHSDHAPILVEVAKQDDFGPTPFKFLDVWLDDATYLQVIKQSWGSAVVDYCDMSLRWFLKLSRLTRSLKIWNKEQFGNIFDNVKKAEERLANVQRNLDENFCSEHMQQVSSAMQDLDLALLWEEKFWL